MAECKECGATLKVFRKDRPTAKDRVRTYCSNACRLAGAKKQRDSEWSFGSQRSGPNPYRRKTGD